MTAIAEPLPDHLASELARAPSESVWAHALRSGRVMVGGGVFLLIVLVCVGTLPWTTSGEPDLYAVQDTSAVRKAPSSAVLGWFGYDTLGRSLLVRCLLGGVISLAVGIAAATIAVVLGVSVGLIAGYRGGWVDSALMRSVDVLYGLPYILLVILFKVAFEPMLIAGTWLPALLTGLILLAALWIGLWLTWRAGSLLEAAGARWLVRVVVLLAWLLPVALYSEALVPWTYRILLPLKAAIAPMAANLVVLFSAIGLVSWLTMARVVRGQVLSLRAQPFIEACRAMGIPAPRVFLRHILPNLIGPVTVYATLTVPQAILQESFLSFLGVGVNAPLPTWGALASEAITNLSPVRIYWWMLAFPCILLVVTLLSLNFMGDGLRDVFDPKREAAKI